MNRKPATSAMRSLRAKAAPAVARPRKVPICLRAPSQIVPMAMSVMMELASPIPFVNW